MKTLYLPAFLTIIILISASTSGCCCCWGTGSTYEDWSASPSTHTATSPATPTPPVSITPVATAKPTFTPTPLPTPSPEPRSLATGTIIANSAGGNGHGELSVTNRLGYDAAFVIAKNSTPKVPQFGVYIGKYSSYKISGIPDGTYILYYTYGKDWDGDLKQFTRPVAYLRFDETMDYTTETKGDYYYYTIYSVTLNPLADGNTIALDVGESGFPDL